MTTLSLTYDDLARRLGITRKSAQNLTRKRGWTRTTGNDGKVRVTVPLDALPESTIDGPSDAPPEGAHTGPSIQELIQENAILKAKLEAADKAQEELREQLSDVKTDRDAWKRQASQTTALLERQQTSRGWIDRILGR